MTMNSERTSATETSGGHSGGTQNKNKPYTRLNLLVKRKHEKDKCELCETVGSLVCTGCKVTYYCGFEHYNLDREFHQPLCSRMKELRKPIEFSPQSETRERWQRQRRIRMVELYEYTWKKGQEGLEAGNYDAAIPASTVSTKYAQDLYGQAPEVIPPLLITAECYLHKGKPIVADGFVARALSIEATHRDIRPFIKARIRRNEGLIHLARNKLADALECFAEEIYQSTEEFGPYHIRTSGGYCYLGHAFHMKGDFDTSASLFRQTVEIWMHFLQPIFEEITSQPIVPMLAGAIKTEKVVIEATDQFEGLRLLTKSYNQQLECTSPPVTAIDLATTCQAISTMHFICERYSEAKNKAMEGQNRILQASAPTLLKHPVNARLHNIIKHCDRKLYHIEKTATEQGSDTDFSTS